MCSRLLDYRKEHLRERGLIGRIDDNLEAPDELDAAQDNLGRSGSDSEYMCRKVERYSFTTFVGSYFLNIEQTSLFRSTHFDSYCQDMVSDSVSIPISSASCSVTLSKNSCLGIGVFVTRPIPRPADSSRSATSFKLSRPFSSKSNRLTKNRTLHFQFAQDKIVMAERSS